MFDRLSAFSGDAKQFEGDPFTYSPRAISRRDPVDGSAADDSGQAALQYVNNMVFQGDIVAVACSGGGVVRGRPRV